MTPLRFHPLPVRVLWCDRCCQWCAHRYGLRVYCCETCGETVIHLVVAKVTP